jgi:cell division protein ZapA
MKYEKTAINVEILGKRYSVACPESEVEALIQSAHYVDGKMREIRESRRVVGLDRIAVMAALNIAHELLTEHHQVTDYKQSLETKMRHLTAALDEAMIVGPLAFDSDNEG